LDATAVAAATPHEERGDTIVRNLWRNGTDCVFDVRMVNLDANSYWKSDYEQVLRSAERQKKEKHLDSCRRYRRDFTPLVFSRDAILAREANAALKVIARKLSDKWSRHYSDTMGYVKMRMGLAIIRSTSRCFRGSRVPIKLISRKPHWEDGAGLDLWESLSALH